MIYKLKGVVQHYDWGGYNFIPDILSITNTEEKPFAEYWMGTHPKAPSVIEDEEKNISLAEKVQLPFLLKILDVKDMLSIQVHPSKKAAAIDFAKENNERIPLDAPNRNYKDDNHKPELAYALNEFWLLHGFKEEKKLRAVINSVPEFENLLPVFDKEGYEGLYKTVMGMPQETVNDILLPLLDRIVPLYQKGILRKDEENFWAARAALTFNKNGNADRGIFSVYFFNLVKLEKDEAIFQDAGIPHAYLEGQNVEIMANSDNVLRGGLTTKHIDVKELMKHTRCEAVIPDILHGVDANGFEKVFKTPAPDFELSKIELNTGDNANFTSKSDEILLVLTGNIDFISDTTKINCKKGEAAFVPANSEYKAITLESGLVFKAKAPINTP